MVTQENFQPQVRDTTNGPNVHTYIPRADGSIVIGGVAYIPQSGVATAATTAVPVTVQLASGSPPQIATHIIPNGGPAIPIMPVLATYPCYSYHPYVGVYPYHLTSYYPPFPASAL
jgi:hypothetical protein